MKFLDCPKPQREEIKHYGCGNSVDAKGYPYCSKTLMGDWVSRRSNEVLSTQPEKIVNPQETYLTTFRKDFVPKPLPLNPHNALWDQKLKGQGVVVVNVNVSEDKQTDFEKNFSTTYDLSYNHFPKMYPGTIPRVVRFRCLDHVPSEEYLKSYGNITQYGLRSYLKSLWRPETQDSRIHRRMSEYRISYPVYESDVYKSNLQLNENVRTMVFPTCNPLTWECNFTPVYVQRCVAPIK